MTYGFKMAADLTETRCTGMMREIEDDLNRTLKVKHALKKVIVQVYGLDQQPNVPSQPYI